MKKKNLAKAGLTLLMILAGEKAAALQVKPPQAQQPTLTTEDSFYIGTVSSHVESKGNEEARLSEKSAGAELTFKFLDRFHAGARVEIFTLKLDDFKYNGTSSNANKNTQNIKSGASFGFGPTAEIDLVDSENYLLKIDGHLLFSPRTSGYENYTQAARENFLKLKINPSAQRKIDYHSFDVNFTAGRKIKEKFLVEAGIERMFERINIENESNGEMRNFVGNKTRLTTGFEMKLPGDNGRFKVVATYGASGTRGYKIIYIH